MSGKVPTQWSWFWGAFHPVGNAHLPDIASKRAIVTRAIDRRGFSWKVFFVASSGFFTDSYNLFATNVIVPSLAYVYWSQDQNLDHEFDINIITLVGSLLGQLLFGFLADRFGRRKLYGLELIVVIFGTLGLTQASPGYVGTPGNPSMSILGWVMFWRFFVGLGIGAEYPLSAVITSEFAPKKHRGRMMAAVFLMQPLGQFTAQLVGLFVVLGFRHYYGFGETGPNAPDQKLLTDRIWRVVAGVGAFPALVAIICRVTIPESPRYTLDVEYDTRKAEDDTNRMFSSSKEDLPDVEMHETEHFPKKQHFGSFDQHHGVSSTAGRVSADRQSVSPLGSPLLTPRPDVNDIGPSQRHSLDQHLSLPDRYTPEHRTSPSPTPSPSKSPLQSSGLSHTHPAFSRADITQYFWTEGNWRRLAGASICWFLLDLAFYGLGINNPRTIAEIWASAPATNATASAYAWTNGHVDAGTTPTMADTLYSNAWQSLVTISIGSIIGSLTIIWAIDYVRRRTLLSASFLGLAVIFAVIGGTFKTVIETKNHGLTLAFYILAQFVFNFGPNTLTFVVPGEVFPTRYRCSAYGIAAASGKLGSIVGQLVLSRARFDGQGVSGFNSVALGWVLCVFAGLMVVGAGVAWVWTPVVTVEGVQEGRVCGARRLQNMSLEEVAMGGDLVGRAR